MFFTGSMSGSIGFSKLKTPQFFGLVKKYTALKIEFE
jgi:hypothetical protein